MTSMVRSLGGDQTEIVETTVIHLAKAADADRVMSLYEQCDWIFAQLTNDAFPVEFVRTCTLRDAFAGKVVVWPSLFFRGGCPDLHYATSNQTRVLGPLGHYHNRLVLRAWQNGLTVSETVANLESNQDIKLEFVDVPANSLATLRERERHCDVVASDIIEGSWQSERLFFTFNHPSMRLIEGVARRILAKAGLKPAAGPPAPSREPLGRIIPPMLPHLGAQLGIAYPTSTAGRGIWLKFSDSGVTAGRHPRTYSLREFIDVSFQCYNAQTELMTSYHLS